MLKTPPLITADQLPALHGAYVYLEPATEAHRELLRPLAKDERLWEFTKTLLIDDTYDTQFDDYYNIALATTVTENGQAFVIRKADDDTLLGMTRVHNVVLKDKGCEIGHTWYVPDVWGKVHNKECKLLLLTHLFERLGFARVAFRVAHQNVRSQKAVEKIGGVREGELRKATIRNDGSWRNTVIFSIIDDEWPEKKKNLQALVAGHRTVAL
jgi:RimJ/RimL family protein N-acetyltransferase